MDDNSPDISNLSFEEKIAVLEEDLPAPVQDFLHSPERDAVSLRLSQKYGLHVDQASAFERAYLYMLLGVNTPDDFVQDLKDAGISEETVRGLTADVNDQVFKKLQQAELSGGRAPAQPTVPVMHVAPPPPVSPAPPAEPPAFNLVPGQSIIPAKPAVRTMQTDMALAQHPEQAPAPSTMPGIPHPSQVSPARSFQTASVPYTSTPAASRPIESTPAPQAPTRQPLPEISSATPAPRPQPVDRGSDPYREPLS